MKPTGSTASNAKSGRVVVLLTALAVMAAGYGVAAWYLWANQRDLVFVPSRDVQRTPADLQLKYEEVRLPVGRADPTLLHGWWLQSDDPKAPALLYLHGNDLNIGGNVEAVARLRRMGFSVLIIDYRGFGKSGGALPSEAQMYEDAEAAWTYLVHERRADPADTFIYGHSLGGAVAIDLALRHPEAAGVIAEATFTSMSAMAKMSYWMFPADWLLNQRFDALGKVARLRVPVLFVHGTSDAEVPYTMSEQLFAATRADKRLTLIPGGGHEDSASVGGALYARAVLEFVEHNRRPMLRSPSSR